MDTIFLTLLEYGVWGFLAFVVVLIIINPSFLTELSKLVDRLSKPKESLNHLEYLNLDLFKLERTLPEIVLVNWFKIPTTILNSVLFIGVSYLHYLVVANPPPEGISSGSRTLLIFLLIIPVVNLIDNFKHIRSSITLELDGNLETLLRFCQKTLFNVKARITKFDFKAGEIEARLYGNDVSIKIEKLENSHNKFTLNTDGRLISTVVYSPEYRRIINNLIRSLCYPNPKR